LPGAGTAEISPQDLLLAEGLHVISYRAMLDVPRELAQYLARLLLAERRRRGTPRGSRALTCFGQAVLGLRWFRDRTATDALARDHGISRATAYRYLDEVLSVLADQAPDLGDALGQAKDQGLSHVILDGTIIACHRCKEPAQSVKGETIDRWYSGKATAKPTATAATSRRSPRRTGSPGGSPMWSAARCTTSPPPASTPCPPSTTPPPTCPHWLTPVTRGAGIGILIPVKQPTGGRELDIGTRTRNAIQRSLRCLGERGFALITGRWRTLQHITASPGQNRRHHARRPRPHPFRARLHQINFVEITSVTHIFLEPYPPLVCLMTPGLLPLRA
jgi:hypothetical protein